MTKPLTPEEDREFRARLAKPSKKLCSPEQRKRDIEAISYEFHVYWTELEHEPPGTMPLDVIKREALAAEALRAKNGKPRPPHFGILTAWHELRDA
jgi:hypothetical protein